MKYIKYLFILPLLFMAAACASDEPTAVAKLDFDVKVSRVTSSSALITVTLKNGTAIEESYYDNCICYDRSDWTHEIDLQKMGENVYQAQLTDLDPAKEYTFKVALTTVINIDGAGKEANPMRVCIEDPAYKFTTLADGDFGDYGDLSAVPALNSTNFAILRLPLGMKLEGKVYVSEDPDQFPEVSDSYYPTQYPYGFITSSDSDPFITFNGLKASTKYYWYVEGTLTIGSGYYDKTTFENYRSDVASFTTAAEAPAALRDLTCQFYFDKNYDGLMQVTPMVSSAMGDGYVWPYDSEQTAAIVTVNIPSYYDVAINEDGVFAPDMFGQSYSYVNVGSTYRYAMQVDMQVRVGSSYWNLDNLLYIPADNTFTVPAAL